VDLILGAGLRGAETRVGSVTRHLGEVRLLPRSAVPAQSRLRERRLGSLVVA
jgi:hypothetical protein